MFTGMFHVFHMYVFMCVVLHVSFLRIFFPPALLVLSGTGPDSAGPCGTQKEPPMAFQTHGAVLCPPALTMHS